MKASKSRLGHAIKWAKARAEQIKAGIKVPVLPVMVKPVVYVVECEGFVKIGYAADVWSRIRDMQIGNPFEILLLGLIPTWEPLSVESELHEEFNAFRVRGEWFKLPETHLNSLVSRAFTEFEANGR